MIEEPGVGTLVVASAGAEASEHVIALRDRTDKNVAFFYTASRNDKALDKLKQRTSRSSIRRRSSRAG